MAYTRRSARACLRRFSLKPCVETVPRALTDAEDSARHSSPRIPQWHETNEIQGAGVVGGCPIRRGLHQIKKPPSARDRWGRRGDTHVETLSTTRARGNRASRHKWRDWHQGRSRMKCQSCQQCHLCIQEGGRVGATGTPQSSCNGLVAASQGHPLPSIGEDAVSPCVLRSGDPSP